MRLWTEALPIKVKHVNRWVKFDKSLTVVLKQFIDYSINQLTEY